MKETMKTSDKIKQEIESSKDIINDIVELATAENREITKAEAKKVDAAHAAIKDHAENLERTLRIEADRVADVASKFPSFLENTLAKNPVLLR